MILNDDGGSAVNILS